MDTNPGMPPLERAIRPSLGVRGSKKEIRRTLDKRPVVGRELLASELFQAVGNPAAVELILQPAIALVKHDAVGHHVITPLHRNQQNQVALSVSLLFDDRGTVLLRSASAARTVSAIGLQLNHCGNARKSSGVPPK